MFVIRVRIVFASTFEVFAEKKLVYWEPKWHQMELIHKKVKKFTLRLMSTIRHAKEIVIRTKALNFISSNLRIIAEQRTINCQELFTEMPFLCFLFLRVHLVFFFFQRAGSYSFTTK